MLLIGNNQRQQCNRLSSTRRHLENAVTPGIEGLLKITHVGILFGVYTRVREQDGEITIYRETILDTVTPYAKVCSTYSMKNFIATGELEAREIRAWRQNAWELLAGDPDRVELFPSGRSMTPGHVHNSR